MLEAIAFYAPALIALRVYTSIRKNEKLAMPRLVMNYGLFLVLINLVLYLIFGLLMGQEIQGMHDELLLEYLVSAAVLAVVLPVVVRMLEASISIEIKRIRR